MNYSRRSNPVVRWLAGAAIIVGAILVFVIFQSVGTSTPSGPIPTATGQQATVISALTPTVVPIQYRLISAEANVSAPIMELYYATDADTWDLTRLGASAGHLEGTPDMGKGGNYVLAGHVELKDGSKGPFADLKLLKPGSHLTVLSDSPTTPVIKSYTVTQVEKVNPNDFSVMQNHGYEEMTLITCDDWDATTQIYNSRIIVHARPSDGLLSGTLTVTPAPSATLNGSKLKATATVKK